MTDINELIEETERLLAAATRGKIRVTHTLDQSSAGSDLRNENHVVIGTDLSDEDARLFAAAPAALRALMAEVERQRQQIAKLQFDASPQPNADWEPTRKVLTGELSKGSGPQLRACDHCRDFPIICAGDDKGEHHPSCKHAPLNPRNAGPRYRSPAVYEGNAGDGGTSG